MFAYMISCCRASKQKEEKNTTLSDWVSREVKALKINNNNNTKKHNQLKVTKIETSANPIFWTLATGVSISLSLSMLVSLTLISCIHLRILTKTQRRAHSHASLMYKIVWWVEHGVEDEKHAREQTTRKTILCWFSFFSYRLLCASVLVQCFARIWML